MLLYLNKIILQMKKEIVRRIKMPVITIDSPKLTKEQKKALVDSFTKSASEIINLPESAMIVLIREMDSEDVGVGGVLLCDRE